jgi:hypothetical protein
MGPKAATAQVYPEINEQMADYLSLLAYAAAIPGTPFLPTLL